MSPNPRRTQHALDASFDAKRLDTLNAMLLDADQSIEPIEEWGIDEFDSFADLRYAPAGRAGGDEFDA